MTIIHRLSKVSEVGWDRDFKRESYLRDCLFEHTCDQCRTEDGLTETSDIKTLLGTPCGEEFHYERIVIPRYVGKNGGRPTPDPKGGHPHVRPQAKKGHA